MSITYKDASGVEGMRIAGKLASEVLDFLTPHIQPGITTREIDRLASECMQQQGSISATLGYQPSGYPPYPASLCTSVNHVVCHGIPGAPIPKSGTETISKDLEKRRPDDRLFDGDILNIDVTAILDGWHGDTSRMFLVGDVSIKARKLVDVTYECLMLGLEQARPGNRLGDISHAIQSHAEKHRYGIVRDFCGHGLGRLFHDSPEVVHAGRPGTGPELRPGMFFTVEPMINIGRGDCKLLDDGWTAVTRDRSLSAQFEHSIGITETGHEVFTLSPAGYTKPPYL